MLRLRYFSQFPCAQFSCELFISELMRLLSRQKVLPVFLVCSLLVAAPASLAQENQEGTVPEDANQEQREATEQDANADNEADDSGDSASKGNSPADNAFRRLSLPPPTNLRYAQQQKWDIERTISADAFETTLVNNEEVLFVINEANLAITKGVAVIIGEAGSNSLSHISMSQLVEPLNDFGWVTVLVSAPTVAFTGEHNELIANTPSAPNTNSAATVTPPDANAQTFNSQNSNADPAASSTTNTAMPAQLVLPQTEAQVFKDADFLRHETQLVALMEQVVTYSSRYPGFFLVIAKGTTSAFLAKLYAEEKIGQPDAFVTLGTYWPERPRNKALAKYIGEIETPVLDLYNSWDNGWTKTTAKLRRIEAERALKLHYRQREIVGQAYDSEQYQYIAKEIYGWLTYMGW